MPKTHSCLAGVLSKAGLGRAGVALLGLLAFSAGAAKAAGEAEARHEQGRLIYNYRCYFCHGYSGNARTLAATFLTPRPTDFTLSDRAQLTPQAIVAVLEAGRPGTAMKSFHGILDKEEMIRLAEFVAIEFIERKAVNTRYHIPENGWIEHSRYRRAFAFATGEIALSLPRESLSPEQAEGRLLYLSSCVSCHDRGAAVEDPMVWQVERPASRPGSPP